MALTITQQPKYKLLAAEQEIIFTAFDDTIVATKVKVKYAARIYVSNVSSGLVSSVNLVSTVKVNANGVGVGIFDLSPILRSYVSPDYEGGLVHTLTSYTSQYNGTDYSETTPHTIHQIDDLSTNRNSVRYFTVTFNIEAADAYTGDISFQYNSWQSIDNHLIYNGVLYDTDILQLDNSSNFGYNLDYYNFLLNDSDGKFLTNAPTKQYIGLNQYMTLGFFSQISISETGFLVGAVGQAYPSVKQIKIKFYYNGVQTGSTITKTVGATIGGHSGYMGQSSNRLQFVGVGTGNLVGQGVTLPTNWDYYTVGARDASVNVISQDYSFYNQDADCKYPTIRLTWLNKFGVWDYYNFQKKSIRKFDTKRKTYTQLSGTWNESKFRFKGHSGGLKHYNTKVTENITINTDFITEAEGIWLEELFISNDVYIIEDRSTDNADEGYMRKYIEPVTITGKQHTRKTTVNDRLIQYTFELMSVKSRKTQRI